MLDVKEECSMVSGEEQITLQSQSSPSPVSSESIKACTGCYTTITPLWRGGPAGPKTLCNACGIKYHKKRRAQMGIECGKIEKPKSKKKMKNSGNSMRSYSNQSNGEDKSSIRVPLKIRMVMKKCNGGGSEIIGRKLGEEEQAALLLMALSCGSIYA